jgi:hypothetical protein
MKKEDCRLGMQVFVKGQNYRDPFYRGILSSRPYKCNAEEHLGEDAITVTYCDGETIGHELISQLEPYRGTHATI